MQGTQTVNYAITGGNDCRLRYWNIDDYRQSIYANTPMNDECQYFTERVAGGTEWICEQISRTRVFPQINAGQIKA